MIFLYDGGCRKTGLEQTCMGLGLGLGPIMISGSEFEIDMNCDV